jgi:tetratricopeptide (TPR) repeat protein
MHNRRINFQLSLVALVAAGVYTSALVNGFTFDDFHKILENPQVTSPDWSNPVGFFVPAEGFSRGPDRIIPQLTYAIQYIFHGSNPMGYHLVNMLLHVCVSVMVYVASLQLFVGRRRAAFLAAMLFAVHPVHADVVASIVGRGELLSSLCMLIVLTLYVRYTPTEEAGLTWQYAITLPILLIGALSKETASWSLPFIVMAVDIYRWGCGNARSVRHYLALCGRRFLRFYMPYFLILAAIVILFFQTAEHPAIDANYLVRLPAWERLLVCMGIFMRYTVLLIWPFRLSCDYSYSQLFYQSGITQSAWIIGGISIALLAVTAALVSLFRRGQVFVTLFIIGTNYFIISNLVKVINVSMAERLIYAASIGFCFLCGLLLDDAGLRLQSSKIKQQRLWTGVIFVLVAFSIRTWTQTRKWQNNFILFKSAYQVCPMSCRVNYNLGVEYAERGQLADALFHYKNAVEILPEHPLHQLNLGEAYWRKGNLEQATACFKTAARLAPDDWRPHYNMGLIASSAGLLEAAATHFEQVVRINPDYAVGLHQLGVVYLRLKKPQLALQQFEKAIDQNPEYKEAYNNMGLASMHLGRRDEALQAFSKALAIDPDFSMARKNLQQLMRERWEPHHFGL